MPDPILNAQESLAREIKEIREQGAVSKAALDGFTAKLGEVNLAVAEVRRQAVQAGQSGTEREMISAYSEEAVRSLPGQAEQTPVLVGQEGQRLALVGTDLSDGERVWGLLDDPHPITEWQRKAQRIITKRSLVRYSLRRAQSLGKNDAVNTPRLDREFVRHMRRGPPQVRALYNDEALKRIFSSATGSGGELLPEVVLPELEREVTMMPGLEDLFESRQFPANTETATIPYTETVPRPYLESLPVVDDPTPANNSGLTTGSNQVTLVNLVTGVQISRYALEDALISAYDAIFGLTSQSLQYGVNELIVHGDNTATHQDAIASWNVRGIWQSTAGAGGASDHRRAQKGLRRIAVDNTATVDGGATQTWAGLLTLAGLLHPMCFAKLGTPGGGLVWLTSPEFALQKFMQMAELVTLDKILNPAIMAGFGGFGMNGGALLPGQIGAIGGSPVVVNMFYTADLAATGLYTGSGSKSLVQAIDRTQFERWGRNGQTIEVDEDIRANTRTVVARRRLRFRQKGKSTTDAVATSYNWL